MVQVIYCPLWNWFALLREAKSRILWLLWTCLVLSQRRAFRTPICQEVPDWPVPALREEPFLSRLENTGSCHFIPAEEKTSSCFPPRLTNCFLPSSPLFDKSDSQKLRQQTQAACFVTQPSSSQSTIYMKQKIGQYFVATHGHLQIWSDVSYILSDKSK